jgi:hypothetical protein
MLLSNDAKSMAPARYSLAFGGLNSTELFNGVPAWRLGLSLAPPFHPAVNPLPAPRIINFTAFFCLSSGAIVVSELDAAGWTNLIGGRLTFPRRGVHLIAADWAAIRRYLGVVIGSEPGRNGRECWS